MNAGLTLYRTAAHVLGATALRSPDITAVCVRRSVASGEATFPWSDLDFDLMVRDGRGATLARVWRRFRLARVLFPRTGHAFVLERHDPAVVAALEPYRASINRRCGLTVRGPEPCWPAPPIVPLELARRVVFWLDDFFPAAMRSGHRRNQRKFRLEMYNALGVLEGRWSEPRISLHDVAAAYGAEGEPTPFASALEAAGRAYAAVGLHAPAVRHVVVLPGLIIVPHAATPFPDAATGIVATPEAVALLLETQRPALWLEHGEALAALGFAPPSRRAWIESAARLAGPLWLRGPGFFERLSAAPLDRLALAERLAAAAGKDAAAPAPANAERLRATTVSSYYEGAYDALAARAHSLRQRLERLVTRADDDRLSRAAGRGA